MRKGLAGLYRYVAPPELTYPARLVEKIYHTLLENEGCIYRRMFMIDQAPEERYIYIKEPTTILKLRRSDISISGTGCEIVIRLWRTKNLSID